MKDRIKFIMEQQGCNQVAFAHMIGIAPATLSGIFNGRTQPTLATAKAIHDRFPAISINWLMFGEGDMMSDASAASPIIYNEDGTPVDAPEGAAPSSPVPSPSSSPSAGAASQTQKGRRGDAVDALVKNVDKSERKISEIRVFFDDGTYEVYLTFKS
jgi:DNA-binding XRE family transcriptional regulator